MDITKTVEETVGVIKDLAVESLDAITPNGKLAAATAIGVVIGGVAGVVGHALMGNSAPAAKGKSSR